MKLRGPKHRLARRFGVNITGTTSRSLEARLQQPPGMHGAKRRRKLSDYGEQLREKQKVRAMYGAPEGQFRRYFQEATRLPGRPGDNLLRLLELRLDNIVYRLGFARTRPMARQLVNHGHILVNGRRVNIPSYQVHLGDVVQLGAAAQRFTPVMEALAHPSAPIPVWLERLDTSGRVRTLPGPQDFEPHINADLIVAYYSR